MKKLIDILNIIKPAHPLDWRTFILISIVIWIASILVFNNEDTRNNLALLSLLILTIAIGIRTNEPPFIIKEISLSPWITSLLLCLIIYQKTEITRPNFALKSWPIIAACLIFILEFIKDKFKIQSPPPLVRIGFIIILLIHINIYCWIEFSLRVGNWLPRDREIIPTPKTLQPDSATINPEFKPYSFLEIERE
jgi:peptidoglycan/LPS O-acetylase OafA/YrhL